MSIPVVVVDIGLFFISLINISTKEPSAYLSDIPYTFGLQVFQSFEHVVPRIRCDPWSVHELKRNSGNE